MESSGSALHPTTSPGIESQDWRSQTQMLRAECNFLRKEKELAERMCEQGSLELENAVRVVHCMRSALQTLILKGGGSCIVEEENADLILQSTLTLQIEILQETLEKLRKSSELREMELLKNCCNFEHETIAEEADIKTCKEVSCNIADQLKSETEQLSQLQMVLHHLQERAKELHKSTDAWQNRAFHARKQEGTLLSSMHEWRRKARSSQSKVSHLQLKLSRLQDYQQNQNASSSTVAALSSTCSSVNSVLYHDKYTEQSVSQDQSKKKENASTISKENFRIPNTAHEWRCKARSSQSKVSHLQSKISRLKDYQQNQNASASTLAASTSTCSSAITVLYHEQSVCKDQSKKKDNASTIPKENFRIPKTAQKQKKSDRNGRIQRSEGLNRTRLPLADVSNSVISDARFNRSQSLALNSNPRKL